MIIICDQCGHSNTVAQTGLVASRSSTVKRIMTVLAKHHPDGIRRNHLRREIGSAYRAHLDESLALLESEHMIIKVDARIHLADVGTPDPRKENAG
jgi:hypothetical protein